tara:strand:- start:22 stop:405 length:384 start_codon:yes stop_codon:yes gene_type:complete
MSKYILLFSVILNGILLMFVTGIVPFFLYLSVIINLILMWYSGVCLLRVNNLESDMIMLLQKNEDFLDELENIHSLEMYYGDEYLQNLIGKSRGLVNDFIDVQEEYFDVQVTELEDDEEDETPAQEE